MQPAALHNGRLVGLYKFNPVDS
jgi:hypothetical protein